MKQENKLIGRLAGAAMACIASVNLFAGEAAPPPAPGATPPGADPLKKPDDAAPVPEVKPFRFEMGTRRDPFIFISELPPLELPPTGNPLDTNNTGKPLDQKLIEQVKAEATAHYVEAEHAFQEFSKEGKAQEAMNKCDEGLKVFSQYPNASGVPDWREIREKLFDLRKAAERVRQRQEAKKKFDELNIRLTGIVSRERNSQAIINSRTVRKGDVVAASDAYDVIVDEIRNDQVVFVFQGFKMALNLSEGPK